MGQEARERPQTTEKGGQTSPGFDFFSGWDPGERKPLRQPEGIKLPASQALRFDFLYGWRPADGEGSKPPSDRVSDNPVRNGVLDLAYPRTQAEVKEFDRLLSSQDYTTVKVTGMPPGVSVKFWMDERGYFFYFDQGHDNQARHYFPGKAKVIEADQKRQLDQVRVDTSSKYVAYELGQQRGFDSMERGTNAIRHFWRLAQLSESALSTQEKVLREATQNSTNPYFRIYLADVLVTQAIQPIVKAMVEGGRVDLENPEAMKKLDEAIEELEKAWNASNGELSRANRFPPGNIAMPLAPQLFYVNPFAFWGGAYDQAQRRHAALVYIRGLIKTGAFRNIELP